MESAYADEDQTLIEKITAWRGDPMLRLALEFRVLFADGDEVWLPLTKDLDSTEQLSDFLISIPMLRHAAFQPSSVGLK